jgi:predicted transcriptional regulator
MKTLPKLGDQEMLILNWIAEHSPSSVRDVAAHFDKEQGLARTTILTVMERLRKKGLLVRKQTEGVFQYSAKLEKDELLQQRVADFVKQTLGGSLSPVLNYFFDNPDLKAEEIEQLKELVSKMEGKRGQYRK